MIACSTRPSPPWMVIFVPWRIRRVASGTPSTAGIPYSRQMIAAWESKPPVSVTTPAARSRTGVQPGSVEPTDEDPAGWHRRRPRDVACDVCRGRCTSRTGCDPTQSVRAGRTVHAVMAADFVRRLEVAVALVDRAVAVDVRTVVVENLAEGAEEDVVAPARARRRRPAQLVESGSTRGSTGRAAPRAAHTNRRSRSSLRLNMRRFHHGT